MANVKATDLIDFTRASKGHALAKVSYAEELVENGDFSSTDLSNWSSAINSTATVTSGELVVTGVSASGRQVAAISTTVGQVYKLSGEGRVSTGSGTALLAVSDTTGGLAERGFVATSETTATDLQLTFVATQSTHYVTAGNGSSGTGDKTFDNISVKEVLFNQPDGTLQLFEHPDNIPRIEYDADGNLLGLLIEEARTNLFTYSEDFTNSAWSKSPKLATLALDSVGPDGKENSAVKLVDDNSSGTGSIRLAETIIGASPSTKYTMSVFAKEDQLNGILLYLVGWGITNGGHYFNLSNGETSAYPGTTSNVTSQIQNVGNGWYRCSITFTTDSVDTSGDVRIFVADMTGAGTITVDFDGTSSILLYGAQFEEGSFPTSYIKSDQGSQTARSADVASIDVDQFGYNQSEGTVSVEIDSLTDTLVGNPMAYQLNDGTTSERLTVFGSSSSWRFVATDGGVQQSSITGGTFGTAKIASSFKQNKFNHCVNGTLSTEDTSGTMPTITELGLGHQNGSNLLNGHIKSITYTPKRLSNAKLQELTS